MNLKASLRFVGILLNLCLVGTAHGQTLCEKGRLSDPPQWISTIELNETTGEILIANPKDRAVHAFDIKTTNMDRVEFPSGLSPSAVTKIQDGFLVKSADEGTAIISKGQRLVGAEKPVIRVPKSSGSAGLVALYANWVTRGSTFVGFGAVNGTDLTPSEYHPGRGFQLGFIRGKVNSVSGQFRDIELLKATEDNDWYLIGFPYFAVTDDGMYYVRMTGKTAAIVRVNETGPTTTTELQVFPDKFRKVPRLKTPNKGPATTAKRFQEIEQGDMVVGLFGQGKMLYVLARQWSKEGTEWLLFQVDPNRGKIEEPVRLPTRAHHLAVVPGPDYWYLIERGIVNGWGDQLNETIIRVPKNWITSPADSPLKDPKPDLCREWKSK